jgi:hypothetical protein
MPEHVGPVSVRKRGIGQRKGDVRLGSQYRLRMPATDGRDGSQPEKVDFEAQSFESLAGVRDDEDTIVLSPLVAQGNLVVLGSVSG